MKRKFWIFVHLYLAAFFLPMVLLVALSGGLYLLGVKGSVSYESLGVVGVTVAAGPHLEQGVDAALAAAGVGTSYAYVREGAGLFTTRPTSRVHYRLKPVPEGTEVIRGRPDLPSILIELHKGHGPPLFKWFQKLFAGGLVLVMASGVTLGLQSPGLRTRTLAAAGAGLAVLLLLALT